MRGPDTAPDAVQGADRWHLLKNIGDALERFLLGEQAALRQAMAEPSPAMQTPDEGAPQSDKPAAPVVAVSDRAEPAAQPAERGTARRQAHYVEVVALHAAGHTMRAIARHTDLSRMTVRKYLQASDCPGPPA